MKRWAALAAVAAAYMLVRFAASHYSFMTLLDYDEAVTGCAAMNVLRGHLQVFQWGQVYTGSLEAILAAPWFAIFPPSALTMRASMFLVGAVGAIALVGVGRRAGGQVGGWMAGIYWAAGPIFLVVITYYVTGGHLEGIIALAVVFYMLARVAFDPPRRVWLWAFGAGVVAGVGMWSTLLVMAPMAACLLGLVLARPRILRSWEGLWLLGGVILGFCPVWIWNIFNDGLTLRWVLGAARGDILHNLPFLFVNVWVPCLVGTFWDGHTVANHIPAVARWMVLLVVYLPAFCLALARVGRWVRRAWARQAPFSDALDMAVICLVVCMVAHAHSSYGHTDVTRYAVALFVPLSVIVGWWVERVWHWRRWAGLGLGVGLVAFNITTIWMFIIHNPAPATAHLNILVKRLKSHGPYRGWGHWRVAYPITFYSGERVICSSFWGWRNYDYMHQVRASSDVGLFAHVRACSPCPGELGEALKVLGVKARRHQVGPWVWWDGLSQQWQPLAREGWEVRFFDGTLAGGGLLKDGQLLSFVPGGKALKWVEIDMGAQRLVNGVCLLPPAVDTGLKGGYGQRVRVRVSSNGSNWQTVKQGQSMLGLVWDGRQVYLSKVAVLQVGFEPVEARFVRVEFLSLAMPVAEVFVFAPGSYSPPKEVCALKAEAERALTLYYENPTGPFVSFLGVPPSYRRAKVFWPAVLCPALVAAARSPHDPFILIWLEELWFQAGLEVGWPLGSWKGLVLGPQGAVKLPPAWNVTVIEGKGWVWISRHGLWGKLKDIGVRERRRDEGMGGGWIKVKEGWVYCYSPSWRPNPEAVRAADELMGGRVVEAELVRAGVGWIVEDAQASGGRVLRLQPGERFKARFIRFAMRGRYEVRLRARPSTCAGHVTSLVKVWACNSYGRIKLLGEASWCGCRGEGYIQLRMEVDNPYQPVRLEVEVVCLGKGDMELDYLELVPLSGSGGSSASGPRVGSKRALTM